jgi:hypothetical protein
MVGVQRCWGEPRVAYRDENGAVRSVPLSWTDRKPPDMFVEVSAGRSILHPEDLKSLVHLVRAAKKRNNGEEKPFDVQKEM